MVGPGEHSVGVDPCSSLELGVRVWPGVPGPEPSELSKASLSNTAVARIRATGTMLEPSRNFRGEPHPELVSVLWLSGPEELHPLDCGVWIWPCFIGFFRNAPALFDVWSSASWGGSGGILCTGSGVY